MKRSDDDEGHFRELFERYYAALCIYAKRFIQDPDTREDIVQDVFCSFWINREKIDRSGSLSPYLSKCVKNRCLNHLRKTSKKQFGNNLSEIDNAPSYADGNDRVFFVDELEKLFRSTLEGLPKEYRIALEMKMEETPIAEVAGTLGVSIRTVERYRKRAEEILRTELKDYLLSIFLFL
jgi:RNA polymerase sigma-70 factor (ECF subfamily)